jgi:hypothetical protein
VKPEDGGEAFVPPKTEKVHWTLPFAGRPRPPGEAIDAAIAFCEGKGVGHGRDEVPPARLGPFPPALLGLPDPVVHCEACGVVPEKKENLPVELPATWSLSIPGNPLDRHPTWRNCACPKCGGAALRETDTMDTFVDSSWYFARFTAPQSRHAHGSWRKRLLDECRSVYRRHRARDPAPALFPLLRPRDAHHGHLPETCDRTLRRALHARHGDARDLRHPR